MTDRQRILRTWLIGYVAVLIGTLPIALPCWNGFLRDALGCFVTIEQIHLGEYVGLGWFAGRYARADVRPWRALGRLVGLVAAVGLVDEFVQGILPQRVFEWSDVGLNLVGGVCGMVAAEVMTWAVRVPRR